MENTILKKTMSNMNNIPKYDGNSNSGKVHIAQLLLRQFPPIPPESHTSCSTSIYIKDLPSNKVCGIRNQERDSCCHITWSSHPPPGNQRVAKFCRISRNIEIPGHLDDSWTNCIDPNMPRGQFNSKFTCESDDGPFSGCINRLGRKSCLVRNGWYM